MVLIRIVRTGQSQLWLLFGVLAGLGLENKHSTLFFGAAVAIGVIVTPLRRELGRPWIWLGAAIAVAIFLPNLLWQWQHDFPTLRDLENVRATGKNVVLAPAAFVVQQIVMLNPATLPVWLAGLWFLLGGRGRQFRVLGWTYLALLAMFMALHAKDYYVAPIYPMLFAAGGAGFEAWTSDLARSSLQNPIRVGLLMVVLVPGAVFAPLALPILEPVDYIAYQHRLGVAPQKAEVAHVGPLPQLWGDQFGWPALVEEIAEIYDSLPADERARTGIFASNYGEAGAINLFGPALDLPPAICAHQTHSMWGPGGFNGDTLIWLQWEPEWLDGRCDSVEVVGVHYDPWGMEEENRPILLCRGLTAPLSDQWPDLTHWN